MAKTPEQAAQAMIDNLGERTGRSLAAWFSLLDIQQLERHRDYLHRIRLNAPGDVDAEVKAWIRQAYDAAG